MNIFTWSAVAPSEDILKDYKSGKYLRLSMILGIDYNYKIAIFIDSKVPKSYKGVVFCCYEKSGTFCHRHILAEYIDEKFSIPVKEVSLE